MVPVLNETKTFLIFVLFRLITKSFIDVEIQFKGQSSGVFAPSSFCLSMPL